jgi:hypothetical protein
MKTFFLLEKNFIFVVSIKRIKIYVFYILNMGNGDWGLGIGDWGLGIWAQPPYPKPQPPNPKKKNNV